MCSITLRLVTIGTESSSNGSSVMLPRKQVSPGNVTGSGRTSTYVTGRHCARMPTNSAVLPTSSNHSGLLSITRLNAHVSW